MNIRTIKKEIEINASPDKVWRVFSNPDVSRQIGGEYVTDWKAGSTFGWKSLDGNMLTNGILLEVIPEKLLRHNLFELGGKSNLLSVITYTLEGDNKMTTLYAVEELNYELTDEQFMEVSEGWGFALQALKNAAERLMRER